MTSKQKLQNALNHVQGEIPIDLGGSAVTGIHCETLKNLREYLGLEKKPITIIEPYQMLGLVEGDLIEALGIDVEPLLNNNTMNGVKLKNFKEWQTPWGQTVLVPGEFNTTDDDQNVYAYPQGDTTVKPSMIMPYSGKFFDAVDRQEPYDEDDLTLEDNLEEFKVIDDDTLNQLEVDCKNLGAGQKGVLASFGGSSFGDIALIPAMGLKNPKGIRGVADWYMLLASDPDFVKKIFDYQLEVAIESLKKIHKRLGDTPDAVFTCGTDFGTQNSTFCSVDTFKDLYKPYYKKINAWIHDNTDWKSFKHSCGSISTIIPELIDSGFDILNPVQWSSDNMDRQMLKDKFGKDIVFWGGAVNVQKTLPFGSAQEVYDEVSQSCKIFGKGGGFVLNATHNIQAKVPAENIVSMFKAVQDYNKGI